MSTIVTRAGKGSPLTNTEVDSNFTNLNTDKLESDGSVLADKIAFDTTAALTPTTGQIVWDADTGTIDIGLNGASAPVMSVGEDQFYRVINQTGSTLVKGALVMANGTVGASGLIKAKLWDNTQPSKTIMGIVLANIPTENNPTETGFGYVLAFGKIKGIQTNGGNYSESWVDGDILFAGSSGGLTKTLPAAPNPKTTVAIVINSHATNGTLFVRVTQGSNLSEDELVQLSGLADGDVLSYDNTDGRFENKTLADAGIVSISGTQTITNKTLTDPAIIGTILEDVYTIVDGADFEIDPSNGSIQLITLGASRTPKATNFAAGEAITLMVNDGTDYTITWTDATWGGTGVVWFTDAGVAPTLATTGYTSIVLWKVSTQVYGARVGDV